MRVATPFRYLGHAWEEMQLIPHSNLIDMAKLNGLPIPFDDAKDSQASTGTSQSCQTHTAVRRQLA
jgi:hypothetical protein